MTIRRKITTRQSPRRPIKGRSIAARSVVARVRNAVSNASAKNQIDGGAINWLLQLVAANCGTSRAVVLVHTHLRRASPPGPAGVPDEYATWYAKGEQDLGLRLYHKWLLLDPLSVAAMHAENDPRFARKKGE